MNRVNSAKQRVFYASWLNSDLMNLDTIILTLHYIMWQELGFRIQDSMN